MTTPNGSTPKEGEESGESTSGEELTPEQIAELAKDKKLAKENQNTRLKLREAERQKQELETELAELRQAKADGTATGREAAADAAKLTREIAELRKENKERKDREAALEEKSRKRAITSTLTSLVGKLQDPASAVELLERRAKVAADDTVVLIVKDPDTGEMVEKEATLENIKAHKLLPEIYYPVVGAPGSGGRGGDTRVMTKDGKSPVDLERALTDFTYYKEHREEVNAARRARNSAR